MSGALVDEALQGRVGEHRAPPDQRISIFQQQPRRHREPGQQSAFQFLGRQRAPRTAGQTRLSSRSRPSTAGEHRHRLQRHEVADLLRRVQLAQDARTDRHRRHRRPGFNFGTGTSITFNSGIGSQASRRRSSRRSTRPDREHQVTTTASNSTSSRSTSRRQSGYARPITIAPHTASIVAGHSQAYTERGVRPVPATTAARPPATAPARRRFSIRARTARAPALPAPARRAPRRRRSGYTVHRQRLGQDRRRFACRHS